MNSKRPPLPGGSVLFLLAILSYFPDLIHYGEIWQGTSNAQIALPIFLLVAVGILTIIYAIFRNRQKLSNFLNGSKLSSSEDNYFPVDQLRSIKRKNRKDDTDTGIGTGVVKIFQQIKDNIGNLDTLTLGYRHLLDLSCEHLDFSAGAVFLIGKDGKMSLYGYSGLKPDSQMSYTIEAEGMITELFTSDYPRFETDVKRIPGNYYDLFDNFRSAWLLPLMPQGVPAGVIVFLHTDIPEHREDYFPKLDFVAIAVSWFYENHSNQILIEKENKRSRMLVKTSLAISMSLDLDKVCNILVKQLGQAYGCSYSYILLNEGDNNSMYVRQVYSERDDKVFKADKRFIEIKKLSWLQDVIYLGNPVLLEKQEIADLPSEDISKLKLKGATKALIAPLKHGGKFEGILFMVEQRSGDRAAMDQEVVNLTAALVAQASAAIENARMYTMLSDKVAHLGILFDVGQALNSDLDLIPFLEKVLKTIAMNLNIANCAFFLKDDETGELCASALVGEYPKESIGRRIAFGEGITGNAALAKKPLNIGDITYDSRFIRSTGMTGSELAVPILLNGEVVGILDVESVEKYAFSPKDEELLVSIVDQVAAAVEKIKLKQQERERASKLAITNQIVKRLSGILDMNDLLSEAVKSLKEGFRFDLVAIFSMDRKNNLILAQQSCRYGHGYTPGLRVDNKNNLIALAARDKKNKFDDKISEDEPDTGLEKVHTRYCIPLVGTSQVHGVLEIQDSRPRAITPIDRTTIQTIADFLSLTLDNVLLYRDTMNKAERLSLSGQINQAITSTLDIEELFARIVRSLSQSTGYHWATLVFKENNDYKTGMEYFSDLGTLGWGDTQVKSLAKYFDEVLVHGRPVYYNITQMDIDNDLRDYFNVQRVNYLAISPIKRDNTQISLLLVGNPNVDGFREQDQYLLADLSQHIQIALNNAVLYGELKNAYDELSKAQEKLIQGEKLKALGEIAAGIAHDFKNIMAAIMGRVQMLAMSVSRPEDMSPEMIKRNLEIIERSADDGVKILSRINEFTKSKNNLKFDNIDLREIISDTIEMTRSKWEAIDSDKRIALKAKLADDMIIQGDRPMMVEIFSNLINNAVDAIESAGEIQIITKTRKDYVYIDFIDTGSGMDQKTLAKIFDPFFTTKNRLGTGLGLAMVYSIIEGHGGEITASSEIGVGTRFSIKLPVKQKHRKIDKFSILIVEDDKNLRNVLNEFFIELNADVALAENYDTAMAILRERTFSIILTDLGLPDKDGWEIIDSVRASSPDSFIVPMTGWNREIDSKELLLRGLTDVLQKPFNLDQVFEVIEKFEHKRTANVERIA